MGDKKKSKEVLESALEDWGLDELTFHRLKQDYKKDLGTVPKSLTRRSPSPPKPIPTDRVIAKFGEVATKLMGGAELVAGPGPTKGESHSRTDNFGIGYTGQSRRKQPIIEEALVGEMRKNFVQGPDHSRENYTGLGDGLLEIGINYEEADEEAEEEAED